MKRPLDPMAMKPLAFIRALELWMLRRALYRRMGDLLERRAYQYDSRPPREVIDE